MGVFKNKHWVAGVTLAFSIIISGGSFAATQQITGRQILDDTIMAVDIATGAVTTTEILDGTILNADISDNTIQYGKIAISGTATDEFCLTYETTGDSFQWGSCTGGATFFDTAGTGLTATGSTINANASDNSIDMNADDFGVNFGNGLQVTTNLNVLADTVGGANLATVINVSANGVAVRVDGSTISTNGSDQLYVPASGITETELSATVAGAGLTGGAGTPLAVGAGTGITVAANTVSVDAGVFLARADVVQNEVPNETPNGVITAFTVDNTIVQIWNVTVNGLEQRPTTDYTVAGATITFTSAPETGDSLMVDYTK